jgi:hypothetical protein
MIINHDPNEIAKLNAVALAMSEISASFRRNESPDKADVALLSTLTYLGVTSGIKLTDPDSLFLLE